MITPSDLKKALIPVKNHASLSIHLDPGVCIGIATPIPNLPENESMTPKLETLTAASKVLSECPRSDQSPAPPQQAVVLAGEVTQQSGSIPLCAQVDEGPNHDGRLEKLYEALESETGEITAEQRPALRKLIASNADVFALSDRELGHTDLF